MKGKERGNSSCPVPWIPCTLGVPHVYSLRMLFCRRHSLILRTFLGRRLGVKVSNDWYLVLCDFHIPIYLREVSAPNVSVPMIRNR